MTGQMRGQDLGWDGVVAVDAEVNVAGVIENANFGFFRGSSSLDWLALAKIVEGRRDLPNRIIQRSIQARCLLGPGSNRRSCAGAWGLALRIHQRVFGSHQNCKRCQGAVEDLARSHSA